MKAIIKPWGWENIWAHTDKYVGKILHINKGHALSLQYHEQKDETIFIHSGQILFEYFLDGGEPVVVTMNVGDSFHITPFMRHRMTAIEDSDILEASTPELDDIVRLKDNYARV